MLLVLGSLLLALTGVRWGQSDAAKEAAPTLSAARALLQQGRLQEAKAMLEQLTTMAPVPQGVHHDLGVVDYRTGKLVEAQKAFEQAVADDPADKESVQMEGLTLYRMGQPARAIHYLEQVRDWMPNADADSNHVLGLCYMNAQRYEDARRAFAQEFGVDANSASAYLFISTMLMQADLPELAAEQADKALQLDPRMPLAHFRLGEVYLFKSNVEQATKEFQAERKMNPGYAPTLRPARRCLHAFRKI